MFHAFPPVFFKNILCFFILFYSLTAYTQEKDSLQQYSYKELDSLYYKEFYNEILLSKKYASASLEKAIREKNYTKEAAGYLRLAQINNQQAIFNEAHRYIDKAITLSEDKIKNDKIKNEYLLFKATIFYSSTDYQKALKYYTETYKYYVTTNNTQRRLDIAHSIASIKSLVGDEEEAKKIFKENYNIYISIEKDSSKTFRTVAYINTLIALSDTYVDKAIEEKNLQLKKIFLDSATFYNTIGFDKSKKYNDLDGYNYFLIRKGIVALEKNNYKDAISDFKLAIKKANEIGQNATLTTIYFHLADSYKKLNDLDTSIQYYKKIDSLSTEDIEQSTYLPETYIALANLYKKKEDPTNAMKYYDLYIDIDKANDKRTIEIRKKIIEDYDFEVFKNEIEALKTQSEDNKTNYTTALVIIIILILMLLTLFIYNRKKQEKNRLAFNDLIKQLESKKKETSGKVISSKNNTPKSKLTIDEQKVNDILKALEKFEQKKQFLDSNCDLAFVAKKVKTNKAYLSKVIHSEKQQKFIQYITNLRINYALEKLKEDKLFRSYDIKSIASELGFKSPDSFSRAFKNKTGIYPSYYIKNINKINTSED